MVFIEAQIPATDKTVSIQANQRGMEINFAWMTLPSVCVSRRTKSPVFAKKQQLVSVRSGNTHNFHKIRHSRILTTRSSLILQLKTNVGVNIFTPSCTSFHCALLSPEHCQEKSSERCLWFGKKAELKSRDTSLQTKVHLVKAMVLSLKEVDPEYSLQGVMAEAPITLAS